MAQPDSAGRRTRAARGALWLSLSSWSAKGAQTIVLLVLAKALTPSEFGILAVAALTYNVMLVLTHLGIVDALTYLPDRIEDASRTALTIVIAGGLILTAGTWALAPLLAHFFHSPDATFVLRGFATGIPFDAAAQVPIGRLTRSLSFSRRTITDALPSVIGAAVTIAVVASGHPLVGLVAGQVTGSVTNAIVATLIGPRCLPGWSTVMARRLLQYGKFLSGADLLNLVLLNVDYIFVGHILGPKALGLYSLAYRICFMPYLSIAMVANGALFPYYCRLPSREAKARTAEKAFSLITALSIPWFAGLVLFADDVTLLGAKWAPAIGAIRFLAVYGLFLSLILSSLEVLKAVGRADLVFIARALHLVVLTGVLIATVSEGITIVALDQAAVSGAVFLVTCVWLVRRACVRPAALARSIGLPALGVAGMVLVVVVLGRITALAGPSWTSLLILGPLALAAFAAIVCAVMPGPLRTGWAALHGRAGSIHSSAGANPAGPDPIGGDPVRADGAEAEVVVVPHLDRLASAWDALVDTSPLPSPFLRSWWLAGVGDSRPFYLLVVRDGQLLGGIALEQTRRLGLPCVQMMGTGALCPDHLDLLALPGHEDAVVSTLRAWLAKPRARTLDLAGLAANSLLVRALPGQVSSESLPGAPWARLPQDPAAYRAARPAGLRKTLRRAGARLTAEGASHRVSRGQSIVKSLEILRSMHEAQWGNQSRFLPEFDRFAAACRLGAERDEVAVHELNAGGTVVAIMVTFEVAGRVSLYQSARLTDSRWRDATTVLLDAIIADACERGFSEVDFLRGDEPYKDNFAPERRQLLRLRATNGVVGRQALRMERAARGAKRLTSR